MGTISDYVRKGLPKNVTVRYYGEPLELELEKDDDNTLPIGYVLLTQTGQELCRICESPPVEGFVDYIKTKWKKYLQN